MTPSDVKYAKKIRSDVRIIIDQWEKFPIDLQANHVGQRKILQLQKYICGNIAELKQVYSATLKYNSKPEIIWIICDNHVER